MSEISILYDGTPYTFQWLKPLLWAEDELKEIGYSIDFGLMRLYSPFNVNFNEWIVEWIIRHKKKWDILFLAFHEVGEYWNEQRLQYLKSKCRLLVWLDTADSTGSTHFEFMPYIDLYLKKQVLMNTDDYCREIWKGRIFSEYYHNNHGLEDPDSDVSAVPLDPKYKHKLRVSWNIGLSDFFKVSDDKIVKALRLYLRSKEFGLNHYFTGGKDGLTNREYDVHYRGSVSDNRCVGYHRELCINAIKRLDGKIRIPNYSTVVPKNQYWKEIKHSKIVLSPFGWGEICFRDFEAFAAGSTLVKPDMSHLTTYPDWYIPYETYVPVNWDFEDLEELIEDLLLCGKFIAIARRAQRLYKGYLEGNDSRSKFARHVVEILDD